MPDVPYSHFVVQAPESLDADVVEKIEYALDIGRVEDWRQERKMKKNPPLVEKLPLPASAPSFGNPTGRGKVASVLRAFACWKPEVGYHPDLSLLAAHILAVTGNEKATFQALVTVYRKYHLEDYFQGDNTQEALQQDAAKIWDAARVNFPDLAYAFSRFNQTELFESTVIALLSTLLTQTYRPAMQAFEYHVRLLHFFLLPPGEYDPEDPRAQLRRMVLHIMARYSTAFLQCSSEVQLRAMSKDLQQFVLVDDVLLEMLNRKHKVHDVTNSPLWPSALMAGLGAVLAYDISSPWGVGANAVSTTCGAVIGFVTGALESAQWSAETLVLTNRALLLHGDDSD